MPVTLQTRDNGHIIYVKTSDPYEVTDFLPVQQQERAHRDIFYQQHPTEKVHLIVDMSEAKNAAANFLRARQTPGLSHPGSGYVVIVGANVVLRMLADTVFRLTRFNRVHFAVDEQDAMTFLQNVDKTRINQQQIA